MSQKKLDRRGFLKGAAMTAAGLLAASCATPTPVVVEKEVPVEKVVKETVVVEKEVPVEKVVQETVVVEKEVAVEKVITATPIPSAFNEAPMLADMVAEGRLPPVEDRVPQEPMVLEPYDEIGQYGGAWKQLHIGSSDRWQNSYMMMERAGKFNEVGEVIPNVVRAWEFNADATELTFYLRKGMKWSDGKPLTTADVMFWWEDVANNKELSPSLPSWIKIGGQPGQVTAIDDYTFTLTFPQPYGAFVIHLPTIIPWVPSHYLKKFHADYAAQAALDAAMEDEGLDTWTDLWAAKTAYANNPGTPDTQPWNPTNYVDEPVQVWERNPYYWKVDVEGNQLPYIDQVNRILVPDQEAILLKVLAGDATLQSRRIESVQNYPTVMENREKGDYRVLLEDVAGSNLSATYCNFFTENEVIRDLLREKDFRHALSLAIDRDEINGIVFDGLAVPSAVSVAIGTPWYKPEYGAENPWIAYDPDQANALLDGLGLDQRDNEGYRLGPDGNRISMIHLLHATHQLSHTVEVHELSKQYWADIGIEVINKPLERQVWVEQVRGAQHDLASYTGNFGHLTQNPVQRGDFAPLSGLTYWCLRWGLWYETDGQDGEEPPEPVQQCYELYAQALAEPDRDTRIGLVQQILDIHAEQTYIIGMVNESEFGRWDVVKNNVGGLPDRIYGSNGLATQFSLMFFRS